MAARAICCTVFVTILLPVSDVALDNRPLTPLADGTFVTFVAVECGETGALVIVDDLKFNIIPVFGSTFDVDDRSGD